MGSEDPLIKAKAEGIMFRQLAAGLSNQAELNCLLGKISDPGQRRATLEKLKPLLKFAVAEEPESLEETEQLTSDTV